VDFERLGLTYRAVRIERRMRQEDVARAARISRSDVSRMERGRGATVSFRTLDAVARALDIRLDVTVRWRGGDLDRLLGARHSAMHERAARMFDDAPAWVREAEATFAIFGERGSIDILAWHPGRRALLVVELKTEIVDVQALVAQVDRYRRLAPKVALARGWEAAAASCWVIVADSSTNRRREAAHRAMLRNAFPLDGRAMKGWLRDPVGRVAGLSFISYDRGVSGIRAPAAIRRVRPHGRRP
jgi:transcriptional regulator with XRE-family HTH domain